MSIQQFISSEKSEESFKTVVIGGGQAGLAAGYFLARDNHPFVILDKNQRTGDSWRNRWDSLRLFTPSKFNSLPGLAFPGASDDLPTKNEAADYLENYAKRFDLPVRHGIQVESLDQNERGYRIDAGSSSYQARNVIIATGPFQKPYIPAFSAALDPSVLQLHASAYRNSQDIPFHTVLVVGAGNSGAEISLELRKTGKQVWLAGRDVGRIPANSPIGKFMGGRPLWWFMNHVLTVDTPMGRKAKASEEHHGTPLGRATRQEIARAGIELVPRLSGIQDGRPQLEDGRILPVEAVLWATGFHPDYRWIHLPIFDEQGYLHHERGVVQSAPGLYFLGLMFQTRLSSSLLGGVGMDAAYIAAIITQNGHRS
jgi:putative flavoprotein involved in K+ transport